MIRDDTTAILGNYCDKCIDKIIIMTPEELEEQILRGVVMLPKRAAFKRLKEMNADISDLIHFKKTFTSRKNLRYGKEIKESS